MCYLLIGSPPITTYTLLITPGSNWLPPLQRHLTYYILYLLIIVLPFLLKCEPLKERLHLFHSLPYIAPVSRIMSDISHAYLLNGGVRVGRNVSIPLLVASKFFGELRKGGT